MWQIILQRTTPGRYERRLCSAQGLTSPDVIFTELTCAKWHEENSHSWSFGDQDTYAYSYVEFSADVQDYKILFSHFVDIKHLNGQKNKNKQKHIL